MTAAPINKQVTHLRAEAIAAGRSSGTWPSVLAATKKSDLRRMVAAVARAGRSRCDPRCDVFVDPVDGILAELASVLPRLERNTASLVRDVRLQRNHLWVIRSERLAL
jgi:hypothetical protein